MAIDCMNCRCHKLPNFFHPWVETCRFCGCPNATFDRGVKQPPDEQIQAWRQFFNTSMAAVLSSGWFGEATMRGELSKLAAKVLAKEIKRQVIAKQRGWYGRNATYALWDLSTYYSGNARQWLGERECHGSN